MFFDCSDFSVAVTPEIGSVLTGNNQQVTFTVSDGENEATVMSVELNLIDDLSWSVESCPSNSELFLDSECNALLPDFTSAIEFVCRLLCRFKFPSISSSWNNYFRRTRGRC